MNKCYFGDGSRLQVENCSQIVQNATLGSPISLGSHERMGHDVVIMGVSHDISDESRPMIYPNNSPPENLNVIGKKYMGQNKGNQFARSSHRS